MKLKLDENLSRHLKQSLSIHQHDVTTAADEDFVHRTALEPLTGCVVIVEPARLRVRSPQGPS